MGALTHSQIMAVVRDIPEGQVATYGQIARLCGHPSHARQVGYALAALPSNTHVPWHRVINARGEISQRRHGGGDEYQRLLLEDEGVRFDGQGRVRLSECQWQPSG